MNRLLSLVLAAVVATPAMAQSTDRGRIAEPARSGSTPTADAAPDLVRNYQATITADDLAAHLYFFASDWFEGRETTARGQKMAAAYLAGQYQKMGVAPAGRGPAAGPRDPAAYFQPFPLYARRLQQAVLTGDGGIRSVYGIDQADGHAVLTFGGAPETSGGMVFGGYGIGDPDIGFDDIAAMQAAGIDAGGKWLMILDGEPTAADGSSLLTADGTPSRWAGSMRAKLTAMARLNSPAGFLVVSPDPGFEAAARRRARGLADDVGSLSLYPPGGGGGMGSRPTYTISEAFADRLLEASGETVSSLRARIAAGRKPVVLALKGGLTSRVDQEELETSSENVIAVIEGSDPVLKDEVVVISSHYDHVGLTDDPDGDRVFNGADDDGSGTVTVLEVAEAFARARDDGFGPRRSVVFLNVSGEEKGLLGSRFYTDTDPVFPLDRTVTNLNIDMVGRYDPTHPGEDGNYVYIIGSNLVSKELHDSNIRMNALLGTGLDLNERFNSRNDPNQFYRRSDHWNFGRHDIPFIFYFTGTHEDYHRPGDEPHKIAYERMESIARLIFATAWQVANQDVRPQVSGTGFN